MRYHDADRMAWLADAELEVAIGNAVARTERAWREYQDALADGDLLAREQRRREHRDA